MRELWAKRIAIFTGLLVLALAIGFAWRQNPAPRTVARAPAEAAGEQGVQFEDGRLVFAQQGCARCHAIAGRGNPRHPLDGVGLLLTREEMLLWITAPEEMREMLPEQAFAAKQAYRDLPPPQLDALADYLMSLREGGR